MRDARDMRDRRHARSRLFFFFRWCPSTPSALCVWIFSHLRRQRRIHRLLFSLLWSFAIAHLSFVSTHANFNTNSLCIHMHAAVGAIVVVVDDARCEASEMRVAWMGGIYSVKAWINFRPLDGCCGGCGCCCDRSDVLPGTAGRELEHVCEYVRRVSVFKTLRSPVPQKTSCARSDRHAYESIRTKPMICAERRRFYA